MQKYIVWFQRDLRLRDNPALSKAAKSGIVLPIYIINKSERIGAASKWWLENSLKLLDSDLNACLSILSGDPFSIIKKLVQEEGVASAEFTILSLWLFAARLIAFDLIDRLSMIFLDAQYPAHPVGFEFYYQHLITIFHNR